MLICVDHTTTICSQSFVDAQKSFSSITPTVQPDDNQGSPAPTPYGNHASCKRQKTPYVPSALCFTEAALDTVYKFSLSTPSSGILDLFGVQWDNTLCSMLLVSPSTPPNAPKRSIFPTISSYAACIAFTPTIDSKRSTSPIDP